LQPAASSVASPRLTDGSLRTVFDAVPNHLTVGAEEELLLLDPSSLDPAPVSNDVIAALGDPMSVRSELWAAQIELVSGVHDSSEGVCADLRALRAKLIAALDGRLRLAGLAAHPLARPTTAFSPGERYARIVEEQQLGARLGALTGGLHIHVAVAGADRALAVYNAMRAQAPLFTALAASAPFIAGHDTGLATVRPMLTDALPRQGVGPRFASWDAIDEFTAWGIQTGAVTEVASLWWECRLNFAQGTIEIRAPDVQASIGDTHALVAMAHMIVADLCARFDAGEKLCAFDTVQIQENRWRAARYGINAELIDLDHAQMVPVRALIHRTLDRIDRLARCHNATTGLERARGLVERDQPALHRRLAAERGVAGIAEWAADQTEAVRHQIVAPRVPDPHG
jgi:carboxylate-amine ligase